MSVETLKPVDQVLTPDSRWTLGYALTLEGHHAEVARFELHAQVPEEVRQHFENARNTWLYSFYAYRLLSVALLMLLVSCEAALKARAQQEGQGHIRSFQKLMNLAIQNQWLMDSGFPQSLEIRALRRSQDRERHSVLRESVIRMGRPDPGPWRPPSEGDQTIAKGAAQLLPELRNEVAHGETLLHPNVSDQFRLVCELINQLFPAPEQSTSTITPQAA